MPTFDYTGDPATHVPERDPGTGMLEKWGIVTEYDEDADGPVTSFVAQLHARLNANRDPNAPPTPETAYIRALKDRKIAELKKYEEESGKLPCKQDYYFDLQFRDCWDDADPPKPTVTRQFRCSGDMNLRTFVEKLILPIMGYCRGYHAWVLTDQKDGAVFATDAQTPDAMHMWNHGLEYILDLNYTVAHLLRKEGDELGWVYDLGDQYRHLVTVTKITPAEQSDGRVELLGGQGACPAEDMNKGDGAWEEIVDDILAGRAPPSVHRQISEAANYKTLYRMDGAPRNWRFDPRRWDRDLAQLALVTSLDFPIAGRRQGPMGMIMKMQGQGSGEYGEEEVRRMACCGECGKPNIGETLKRCGKCRVSWYCGAECQRKKWPKHKDYCKTMRAEDEDPMKKFAKDAQMEEFFRFMRENGDDPRDVLRSS